MAGGQRATMLIVILKFHYVEASLFNCMCATDYSASANSTRVLQQAKIQVDGLGWSRPESKVCGSSRGVYGTMSSLSLTLFQPAHVSHQWQSCSSLYVLKLGSKDFWSSVAPQFASALINLLSRPNGFTAKMLQHQRLVICITSWIHLKLN